MLKIDIKNQIIAGFICVIIFILFIGVLGWYSVEKIDYIENSIVTWYKIKIEVLECRRQEKSILLRGLVDNHIILWQKSFDELGRLNDTAKKKGYISYKQSEMLTNVLAGYKEDFAAFINEFKSKKVLNTEEITVYNNKFIISGQLLIAFSEKIIMEVSEIQRKTDKKVKSQFLFFSIFGIIAIVFLGNLTIRVIGNAFKKIKKLNDELERNYLEIALGLSEDFEVLRRVSNGDFKVKAPEDSNNELLAKLGEVINQTVQQLNNLSRQEFEKIFDVSASGIRVVDKDSNVIKANQAMAELSGLSWEEILNGKCYEQFKGPFCFTDKCTIKQILGGAERVEREMYNVKHDGSKVFCMVAAVPLRNNNGDIIGIVEDFTDITRIKQIETDLQLYNITIALGLSEIFETLNNFSKGNFDVRVKDDLGNELLNKLSKIVNMTIVAFSEAWRDLESAKVYSESIIDAINDMLIVTDKEMRVVSINPAAMELLGYTQEDFLGKTAGHFFAQEDSPFLFSDVVKLIKQGRDLNNYETIFVSKHGRRFPVLFSCAAIKGKEGGIIYMVCMAKDISERKQAEEKLKKAYEKLRDLQSQLVQAEKMGAIGELAGGVAHEINNPLTGVLNNAQLIKMIAGSGKELKFDEIKDLLNAIEESALRCKKITEGLLDFSHASMDSFTTFSLNAVINKVNDLISNEMKLQNIEIRLDLQPDLPLIQGDPQLLQQIIVNLISNARWAVVKKFDKAGGFISVKTEYESKRGFINMYIADNGIGIDEDKINKIFEPFFTTKQVGEGTGLGLSVVYNIIKKHKGTIEVFSKKNEGTSFKISLPVVS